MSVHYKFGNMLVSHENRTLNMLRSDTNFRMMTLKTNCTLGVPSTTSMFVGTVHTASLSVCTVLVIFVLLMGCIGNLMVIYGAVKNKRIRTNFDVLILNLTGADFITCTFLSPTFLYLLFNEPPVPKMFCGSILFLGSASGMLSMLTLVAIALHRLARVIGRAKGTLSMTRTAIILTMIWILSITLSVAGTVHVTHNWSLEQKNCQSVINSSNPKLQNFVLFFVAPVIIVSFTIVSMSYIIIAIIVHRQTNDLGKTVSTRTCQQCRSLHASLPCRDNKALTMCLVVILLMGLCWGPLITSHFIEIVTGESIILFQVKLCGIALVFLNSALDPYIYAQHIGKMKQRYSKLFNSIIRCCCKEKPITDIRSSKIRRKECSHVRAYDAGSPKGRLFDKRDKDQVYYHSNILLSNDMTVKNSSCFKTRDIMKTCLVEESIGFINASCSQGSGKDLH